MQCLLKYKWVKLPRNLLPPGKGLMGAWTSLAARAAFRPGQAKYCGHINDVTLGSWVGGIVGLKSILGIKNRQKALDVMDQLAQLGYITYSLDSDKKLTYTISDWIVDCSGEVCSDGAIYATEGYGFLCLPRNIAQRLVDNHYIFEESDAWLDLWCHTVWHDNKNIFSFSCPTVQFGQNSIALTLEKLGSRWGWEKTKVWRFLQKHRDVFTLHKLPGSFGCLIFNTQYPTGTKNCIPADKEIIRILDEIRILGENTHFSGSDHEKINRFIAWYSKKLALSKPSENRVALPLYAYISLCENCRHCGYDCRGVSLSFTLSYRDFCKNHFFGGYGYG